MIASVLKPPGNVVDQKSASGMYGLRERSHDEGSSWCRSVNWRGPVLARQALELAERLFQISTDVFLSKSLEVPTVPERGEKPLREAPACPLGSECYVDSGGQEIKLRETSIGMRIAPQVYTRAIMKRQ